MLPLQLIWVVAVAGAVAEWPARRVAGRAHLYRHVYSTAVTVLAATATHAVSSPALDRWLGSPGGTGSIRRSRSRRRRRDARCRRAVGGAWPPAAGSYEQRSAALPSRYALSYWSTRRLGMLVWLSLPAAIALQRMITRSRLRNVADDALVRPMAEEAWFIAATEVVAALPVVSIIRITTTDPIAVSAVAQMQAGCDAIGYLGADGLGMLLVDCPSLSAEALATRLRTALRKKGVEGKVAAAGKPRDGYGSTTCWPSARPSWSPETRPTCTISHCRRAEYRRFSR